MTVGDMEGKIIIISAPSGSGKSTIIGRLMERGNIDMEFSVSATNRSPRGEEIDGRDYHFLTTEQFAAPSTAMSLWNMRRCIRVATTAPSAARLMHAVPPATM